MRAILDGEAVPGAAFRARPVPAPLVVRGYGAGADVTATGVLGDGLELVDGNLE